MSETEHTTMTRAEERWLAAALEERFGGLQPPDLSGAILAKRAAEERAPRVKRLLAAVLLAAGLATVALVPILDGAGPAQDPEGSYLPLGIGAKWEYEVEASRMVESVLGSMRVGNRDVYLVQRRIEAPPYFWVEVRYLASDADGVWRYQGSVNRPALAVGVEAERILRLPAEAGAEWQWTVEGPVRAPRSGARVGTPATVTMSYEATVMAVDAKIVVPAGTFRALRVRIESDGSRGKVVEDVWYARGTGVVRVETRAGTGAAAPVVRRDLVRFTPGCEPFDWEADLASVLAKSPELGKRGMPDEVRRVELAGVGLALQSRFALLRWGDDEVIARVSYEGGAVLAPFDPSDLGDWNALVADEPLYEKPEELAQMTTETLAELAGRLHAARAGMEVVGPFDRDGVVIISGNTQVLGEMRIRSATGEEETLQCHATIEEGRVTAIGLR